MNYDEIYRPLSRTSFASKMEFAFWASAETMSPNGQVESDIMRFKLLPDEIETFVLYSVAVKEYNNYEMTKKQFKEVMNAIRQYLPKEFCNKSGTDRLKWILPTIGAVQLESQQYLFFRMYRHHYLFSFVNENVNVDEQFRKKFGKSYDEYAAIVYIFHMLISKRLRDAYKYYKNYILLKEAWFINNLKMTRDQYNNELRQFAQSKDDYRYCLRPSYSYPFIEFQDEIYLPTPHLLIQSITTAMMNRLTFENDTLREKIGKNACESYLLRIVSDSAIFDDVVAEYEYSKGKRTLDVLARKGKVALLMDSKLFSPKVSLRTYNNEAYKKDLSRIVKEMKQAYSHARDKFLHEYNPFSSKVEDIYSLVVVYQEGYIDLKDIYAQTARELLLDENSDEYEWLWRHVGFTNFAILESFLLTKTDIVSELNNRERISDEWLMGKNRGELSDEVRQYMENLEKDANKLISKFEL